MVVGAGLLLVPLCVPHGCTGILVDVWNPQAADMFVHVAYFHVLLLTSTSFFVEETKSRLTSAFQITLRKSFVVILETPASCDLHSLYIYPIFHLISF
jgi:hypothetical protein